MLLQFHRIRIFTTAKPSLKFLVNGVRRIQSSSIIMGIEGMDTSGSNQEAAAALTGTWSLFCVLGIRTISKIFW
jgi:hypothetical protein